VLKPCGGFSTSVLVLGSSVLHIAQIFLSCGVTLKKLGVEFQDGDLTTEFELRNARPPLRTKKLCPSRERHFDGVIFPWYTEKKHLYKRRVKMEE